MITDRPLVKVRRARPGDADALANVFCESWRNAYTGIIPFMHLQRMIRARDATWWKNAIQREGDILVLDVASVVAGYATFGAARSQPVKKPMGASAVGASAVGEIYELYFLPVYQGLGLGEHLFEACRQNLDARKMNGLVVWALSANEMAVEFYRRRGGRSAGQLMESFGPMTLAKTGFRWA
jgi:ribosomal protein S18 acetylase RimI-like enzyme